MSDTVELLLVPAAADELGMTIREVYDLIASGELEPVARSVAGRRGRWVHVSRGEVEALRASRG